MGLPCTEPEDSLIHPGTQWLLRPVPEWGLGDPSGHAEFAVPARRPSEVNSQSAVGGADLELRKAPGTARFRREQRAEGSPGAETAHSTHPT